MNAHTTSTAPLSPTSMARKPMKRTPLVHVDSQHCSRNIGLAEDSAPVFHLVGDAQDCAHDELEGWTGETESEMSVADGGN